jgi:hypothetical protein
VYLNDCTAKNVFEGSKVEGNREDVEGSKVEGNREGGRRVEGEILRSVTLATVADLGIFFNSPSQIPANLRGGILASNSNGHSPLSTKAE